jgi:hypothetical protein
MPEKLFKFLLHELSVVRVVCGRCRVVTEVPADRREPTFKHGRCPACQSPLQTPDDNGLVHLAATLSKLKGASGRLAVEFVVPART